MRNRNPFYSIMFFSTLFIVTQHFVPSQTHNNSCILDIQSSNASNKERGDWGGFLTSSNCSFVFYDYLYALARHANQTENIYLSSTEQDNCLLYMKTFDKDVLSCGIDKLTRDDTGCSSYTTVDVGDKLDKSLQSLHEACMGKEFEQSCSSCLKTWEEIGASTDNVGGSNDDANICRFSVLVTLTSNMIDNGRNNVQPLYNCLALHNILVTGEGEHSPKLKTGRIILLTGLLLLGTTLVLFAATWIFYSRKRQKSVPRSESGSRQTDASIAEDISNLKIPVKEIYTATDNLSQFNFIGQGISGKVYKGVLSSGKKVAVKHIVDDGHAASFVREVTSLSHVRHPNLVALLGCCKHEDEYFLVYELCHNGNLSEWLYGKHRNLPWIKRLEIAIDSAKGLWFLHSFPEGCIVHRDIKPTNILLDSEFQAKLSDFGLSKVMDVGQSYVSSEVRGTFGYVDPEYRANHHVNAKGDVYSFGIVLLQIISGQKVINLNLNTPMQLNKLARVASKGGDVAGFVDPKLNGEYSEEAFDIVLEVALACTGLRQERPSMEEVLVKLQRALDLSTELSFSFTDTKRALDLSTERSFSFTDSKIKG